VEGIGGRFIAAPDVPTGYAILLAMPCQ